MRVISINVNGMKAAIDRGLLDWLAVQSADIICVQDTRASWRDMESPAFQLKGYLLYYAESGYPEQPGGVAIYSRLQPKAVITGLGFPLADHYGRYLQADFDKVSIASLLLPSGQLNDDDFQQKLQFMEQFTTYLGKQRTKRRNFIYCGSLFVAHTLQDVKNGEDCQNTPGFTLPEQEWLDNVIEELGFVDGFRRLNHEDDQYTWWADSEQAEMLNLGWRFDYQLLTPDLRSLLKRADICRKPCFSQHAALTIDYDWTLSI